MNNKIITTIFIAIIFVTVFNLPYVNSQPSQRMKHGFYIGANGGGLFPEYFFMFRELGYKTNVDWGYQGEWQPYADWMANNNRLYGGFYDTLVGPVPLFPSPPASLPSGYISWLPNGYYAGINNFLTSWYDSVKVLNTAFLRSSKIDKPAFGQRSIYQVEDNAIMISKKPGYGYVISETGQDENDSNVRVKRCVIGRDPPNKYIAKQLYENNEQTNVITRRDFGNAYYSDRKRVGDNFRWYIKPRMRIESAFANNPANRNKKVIRVEIFNYSGRMIWSYDVNVQNFLDPENQNYNGSYIEMYNNFQLPYYPLSVLGDSLATDNIDTSAYYTPREKSHVDYRIYWYGEVNVWLDYVKVDDEWAHFLFDDSYPDNRYHFVQKIKDEVTSLSNISGFGYFYFDEFYYNNIPCLKEVLRLIKYYNPNAGILFLCPPAGCIGTGVGAGIKNELTLQEMYDYLNSQGLYVDFVANDEYTFFDDTPLPPNIRKPNPTKFPGTIMYRNATSSEQYNDYINTNVLNFRQIYQIDANLIKNDTNKAFVATIQAHTVETNFLLCPCGSIPDMERKREPTNEEISLQAFYAMTYGAKQIHYFTQFSSGAQKNNCPEKPWYYDWGLTYLDISGLQRPRDTNYYGQHKWNYIERLDSSMSKIGKYMYEVNDLRYDNTVSIQNGERYSYISDLKSYFRNHSAPYEYSDNNMDPANKTYWEIGFFKNNAEPDSKYFLILNKRCTPEIKGGDGDLRIVKIYLNANELSGYNSWILINPITNEKITFDKNNIVNGVRIPGEFLPGEGKLFKIEPSK